MDLVDLTACVERAKRDQEPFTLTYSENEDTWYAVLGPVEIKHAPTAQLACEWLVEKVDQQ